MTNDQAIVALAAMAQEHRMRIFRTLMRAGPSGMAAGEIGDRLDLAPSKLSFHVAHLERAGLLRSWRVHRNIFYAVEIDAMRQVLEFLTADCCDGHPEICGSLQPPARACGGREEIEA